MRVKRAHRPANPCTVRDNIRRCSRVDLRHRDDKPLLRVIVSAHNRLDRLHHSHSRHHRVNALMWHCSVPALALYIDIKTVDCRHDRPRNRADKPRLKARSIVDRIDLINPETLHHTFLDHGLATTRQLLVRLENKHSLASKVPCLAEIFCSTK